MLSVIAISILFVVIAAIFVYVVYFLMTNFWVLSLSEFAIVFVVIMFVLFGMVSLSVFLKKSLAEMRKPQQ